MDSIISVENVSLSRNPGQGSSRFGSGFGSLFSESGTVARRWSSPEMSELQAEKSEKACESSR